MPVYTNIQEWECDRCGYKDFAADPNDPVLKSWRTVRSLNSREDAREMVLCPKCAPEWDRLMAKHDEDVSAFLSSAGGDAK